MNSITIYNKETGIILRNVSGLGNITDNVLDGEDYIEGQYSTDTYIVVDKKIKKKSKKIIVEQNKKQAQIDLRNYRNSILDSSDWTQCVDSPLSDIKKLEWQTYRQELRDLPATYKDIESIDEVNFPKEPE